tara:strand:+ start:1700 stop:2077 length:378 start_codon:yes stop_codon:yes gene_type:complete
MTISKSFLTQLLITLIAMSACARDRIFSGKIDLKDCLSAEIRDESAIVRDHILGVKAIAACKSMLKNSIEAKNVDHKNMHKSLKDIKEAINRMNDHERKIKVRLKESEREKEKFAKILKAYEKID